jgi:hypothetical protein
LIRHTDARKELRGQAGCMVSEREGASDEVSEWTSE